MTPPPSILAQFTHSRSSGYPEGWTQVSAYDFYVEGPRRLAALEAVGQATLRATLSGQSKVIAAMHGDSQALSNTIGEQLQLQTRALANAFADAAAEVSDAVREGTTAVCDCLREVSWGLAQVGSKLDDLIYLQRNRRSVEARELLTQALRHLRAENYDFANERLLAAFNLDNTDYAVLYNLGIVAVFRERAEEAAKYFKLSARVPDEITSTAKARALFSLARAQFILHRAEEAAGVLREAHALDSSARNKFYLALYLFHAGRSSDAVEQLRGAILQDPGLFATAAVCDDLNDFADAVARALEKLRRQADEEFKAALQTARDLRSGALRRHLARFPDAPPNRALLLADKHAAKAESGSYLSKVLYARIVKAVSSTVKLCVQECEGAYELTASEGDLSRASDRLQKARGSRNMPECESFFIMYVGITACCMVGLLIMSKVGIVKLSNATGGGVLDEVLSAAFLSVVWPVTALLSLFQIFVWKNPDWVSLGCVMLVGMALPVAYSLLAKASSSANYADIGSGKNDVADASGRIAGLQTQLAEVRIEIAKLLSSVTGNRSLPLPADWPAAPAAVPADERRSS